MCEVESQRHDPAQRQSTDYRLRDATGIEHSRHVADRQFLRIEAGISRVAGLAMSAHIPKDHLPAVGQRRYLPVPHPAGRPIAVGQQDRRSAAVLS